MIRKCGSVGGRSSARGLHFPSLLSFNLHFIVPVKSDLLLFIYPGSVVASSRGNLVNLVKESMLIHEIAKFTFVLEKVKM